MGQWEFWAVAMVMIVVACATLIVPALWIRRAEDDAGLFRGRLYASLAIVVTLPVAALTLYGILGSPSATSVSSRSSDAQDPHVQAALGSAANPGDLANAIRALQAKLKRNPADADGWRLLSRAYAFVGKTEAAAQASEIADRLGRGEAPPGPTPVADVTGVEQLSALEARVRDNPSDREGLVLIAEAYRRQRQFPEAIAAFQKLVERKAMNADLWADYADAVAASQRSLNAQSAALVVEALRMDPNHPKALWLLGSWQTKTGDYRAALGTWEKLIAILPPDSPDANIIAANLREAQTAIGRSATPEVENGERDALPQEVAVWGEVNVDPKLRERISSTAVLFVFAKPVGQSGPPLAVTRSGINSWPIRFRLDDSASMLPDRKLSQFDAVIVEARISRSGSPAPQRGDFRAVSPAVNPRSMQPLQLVISEEIG